MAIEGRVSNSLRWIVDSGGRIVGYRNPVTDQDQEALTASQVAALQSGGRLQIRAAMGVVGQSNEQGATLYQDALGVWQRASVTAPMLGLYEPVKPNITGHGSMFTQVAALLFNDGIHLDLHNGAVGGTSMYLDWSGYIYMAGRSNSTAYRGLRTTLGVGDPGHRGDQIFVNGAVWEATTGNRHLAFWNDPANAVTVNGVQYFADPGSVIKEVSLTTAASSPVFPGSPVVGNTVTDGGIVWTCISVGAKVTDASNVHVLRYNEDGFDPYYMAARLRNSLMSSPVSTNKRYVYFQNGQADAGVNSTIYAVALRTLGQYFGQSPYLIQPIYGLSIYYPAQSKANWDLLETALSGAGVDSAPNYATSPLSVSLSGVGYHLATPGAAITSFGFYYGTSLYRAFGTATTSMLQPSDPHVTVEGLLLCAQTLAPAISRIVRNSAT